MYLVLIYSVLSGIWYFVKFNYFFCSLIIFYYVCIVFRYWFPYFNKDSHIRLIRTILRHLHRYGEKYFYCNLFTIEIDKSDTWTINSFYIHFLEKKLIEVVKNNEDKIKSAMTNPGK